MLLGRWLEWICGTGFKIQNIALSVLSVNDGAKTQAQNSSFSNIVNSCKKNGQGINGQLKTIILPI